MSAKPLVIGALVVGGGVVVLLVLGLVIGPRMLKAAAPSWDEGDIEYTWTVSTIGLTKYVDATVEEAWTGTFAALEELGYVPSDETPRLPPDIMSRMVANRPDGGELSVEIQRHDDGRAAVKLTMEGELAGDTDDAAAMKEYTTAANAVARDFFVALTAHLGD